MAADNGNLDVVECLIANKAEVNVYDEVSAAIMFLHYVLFIYVVLI